MRPDAPDLVSDHANVKTDPFAMVAALNTFHPSTPI